MVFRRNKTTRSDRKRGESLPNLSDREFLILRALQSNLRQGLYGIEIRDTVADENGVTLPWGSLYVMLGRLVEKGFVERVTADEGDPRRQHYRLVAAGATALAAKAAFLSIGIAPARAMR